MYYYCWLTLLKTGVSLIIFVVHPLFNMSVWKHLKFRLEIQNHEITRRMEFTASLILSAPNMFPLMYILPLPLILN